MRSSQLNSKKKSKAVRTLEETGAAYFEVAVEAPVQVDTASHALIARAVKLELVPLFLANEIRLLPAYSLLD